MKTNFSKKTAISIASVVTIGVLLGALILRDDHSNTAHAAPHDHGAHGDEHKTPAQKDDHGKDEHGKDKHGKHAHDKDEHGHADAHGEAQSGKGPHGGKLFVQHGYGVEVTIAEQNGTPHFRLYTYQDGKPLPSAASKIELKLERLGRAAQTMRFTPEKDYLLGNTPVPEPHSFKVSITAQHGGKTYPFSFEQIEGRINMDAQQRQKNGLAIQTASALTLHNNLHLLGEVRINEDQMLHVVPRLAGIVESVLVSEGDQVSKGQLLAVITSQALVELRSDYLASQKRLNLARSHYAREKKLWEEKISAQQDYLQAGNALQEAEIAWQSAQQKLAAIGAHGVANQNFSSNKPLNRFEIRAPLAGTITEKHITTGHALKEDASIFTIADLRSVWVDVNVPAKDLPQLKQGQSASISAQAFTAQAEGKLSYVSAVANEQTRSAKARLVLANPKGTWYPGMAVNVVLKSGEVAVPVAVANDAIQTINDQATVFGSYGNVIEARPVELGRSDGKFTEIISGLLAGENYVAKNSFLVKAELGKSAAAHEH